MIDNMRNIYTLHKILGLITAVVFIVVCMTGFFLLFRGEIAERTPDDVEYVITDNMDSSEIWSYANEAISALKKRHSMAQVESIRLYESSKRLSLRYQAAGKSKRVFYDVSSKSLISPTSAVKQDFIDFSMQQFSRIHKNLGMGCIGRNLLYILCILTVLTIVTGYYINHSISKQVPLGVIRKNSRRLWLSDWHRFISSIVGPWALIMTLSGVMIFAYSDLTKVYYSHAYEAVAAISTYPSIERVELDEVISLLSEEYPSKKLINIVMPEDNNGFYEIQIANARENTNLYVPYELILIQADNVNNRIFIPDTGLRNIFAEALNIHIHNHYLLVTKILWGIMALLSVAMAISGLWLYMTRWWNKKYFEVPLRKFNNIKGYHIASVSAVLSMIAMLIPLVDIKLEYIAVVAFIMIFLISMYAKKKLN